MLLGTAIESALKLVGVDKDRVERFLGEPCGCQERRDKLDELDAAARRAIKVAGVGMKDFFERLLAR